MLLINTAVMLIVGGNAHAFLTRSGNVIRLLIDLSSFCRIFKAGSKTTIRIYIGHDVLFINEVHNDIGRNSRFEILLTL